MRKILGTLTACALAGLVSLPVLRGEPLAPAPPADPSGPGEPDDTGEVCSTGCAAEPQSDERLPEDELVALLEAWAALPIDEAGDAPSEELDVLLFHGAQVREWLERHGGESSWLDDEHARFLAREAARDRARLSVRILDPEGSERLVLESTSVPLGEKQHLFPQRSFDLQPPEISGTVKRVGQRHLWARL